MFLDQGALSTLSLQDTPSTTHKTDLRSHNPRLIFTTETRRWGAQSGDYLEELMGKVGLDIFLQRI